MKYIFTLQLLITLLLSCCGTKEENVNLELKGCINSEVLNQINNLQEFAKVELIKKKDFDLFDSIAKFESKMISKNILIGRNERDYKSLINDFEKNLVSEQSLNSIYDKDSFIAHISNSLATQTIYNNCPLKILEKEKSRQLAKSKDIFDKIMFKGYYDFLSEIKEYSDLINYQSDIERLLLTNLIYTYLNTGFWNKRQFPDLIERDDGLFYEN